jgi:predicted nuclease with TOPRIM domain
MIKAEEVYTPEQYQSLNALYKQAIEENKAKEFDLVKFEHEVEQLKYANDILEENLGESIGEAYLVEESWNPDIEGVSKREYLYKDLYSSEKEENEKLEEGISERDKYIKDLENGYSQIEIHIFGKDETRSIETIVEKVSVLKSMVSKFVNLIEYIKDKIPFVSDMFNLTDKELIKDAVETTKQAQKALEEENTSKDTSEIEKDATSDSKQSNKSKKFRP